MADEPTTDNRHEAILTALRETGASAPAHDLDALATTIGTHIDHPENTEVTQTDDHSAAGGPDSGSAIEHSDDAADQATAADIAAGKVVEPSDGGRVEPVDG